MAKAFVDGEIENNPVVLFSKSYCPFCKMAKGVLNETGAKFTVHELDDRGQLAPLDTCMYLILSEHFLSSDDPPPPCLSSALIFSSLLKLSFSYLSSFLSK